MDNPFIIFPALETERLRLEQLTIHDLDAMYEIKSDPKVTYQYGRNPHTSLIQTESWITLVLNDYVEKKTLYWKIVNKENLRIAGSVTLWNMDLESFMAEVGYELRPEFWNRGIMPEALHCLLDWSFGLFGLNRVEACPLQDNSASVRVLEKSGFKLEGTLRQRAFFQGRFLDQYYYSILKTEWEKRKVK